MKTQILEKLNDLKNKSGKSYEDVHEDLGFATSTVHRWHKGESTPDIDDLTTLVEYYGGNMRDLFAAVGQQEMTATQSIGYQGADVMVEHYEARLAAKDEKYNVLQAHHEQRILEINESHAKSVSYLMDEIKRLRGERDSARETSLAVVGKKQAVFWSLVGIDVIMAILLFIALFTGPIV